MKLPNYVSGLWKEGAGAGEPLIGPASGEELARISSQGVDARAALEFARSNGGPALRAMTYRQRAELLAKIAEVLTANRDEYFRISLLNLGANQADASFDVDGAIYMMKYYAKIGQALAEGKILKEGAPVSISKIGVFVGQHFSLPTTGVAVLSTHLIFRHGACVKRQRPHCSPVFPSLLSPLRRRPGWLIELSKTS